MLFGGSFLIVPTSVTAFVRKAVVPRSGPRDRGMLTVWFAIGQCVGPWLSGVVSDTQLRRRRAACCCRARPARRGADRAAAART